MYINKPKTMEHHDGTGCRTLEGPILCINNCGFFGSATTMNMCSKCHKDYILKQEQAQLAASSIDSIVNGSGAASEKEAVTINSIDLNVTPVEAKTISTVTVSSNAAVASESSEPKPKGPTRCTSCKKKVGLTGFSCRCGHIFCTAHRYADQHDCSYDFQSAGRDAIAKANPLIKADKLDNKI